MRDCPDFDYKTTDTKQTKDFFSPLKDVEFHTKRIAVHVTHVDSKEQQLCAFEIIKCSEQEQEEVLFALSGIQRLYCFANIFKQYDYIWQSNFNSKL